jgi:hypothetical protein
MGLWTVAAVVFALNVPFGYWRARTRKFSPAWFLAIHLPIPLIVLLRVYSGLGFELSTFPLMLAAYFIGQFLGARLRPVKQKAGPDGEARRPGP